jgi:hypothetical protein
MRKIVVWLCSSVFALAVYALLNLLGVSQIPVLIFTFIGAMCGATAGALIMQRREARADAGPPPGPGSERKAT